MNQSHLRPRSSQSWWFGCAAVALAALAVAPIWASRFLPLLDDPNHLSAIYIWHGLSHAVSSLQAYYEPRFAPVSYLAHYGLAFLFAEALGVEAAHKLVLSLYVLAIPCAAYFWCRQTGRTPWLSLLTIPLAFSNAWAHGYHPFNVGMAMFLLGVVAYDRLLQAPSYGRWLWAAGAAVGCYFGHPFALALLYVGGATLWLVHASMYGPGLGPRLRMLAVGFSALLPSLGLLLWQSRAAAVEAGAVRKVLGADFPVLDWPRWRERLLDMPEHAINPVAGSADSHAFIVLLGVAVALWWMSVLTQRPTAGTVWPNLWTRLCMPSRGLWLALVLLGAYLVLPEHFDAPVYMWIARGRIAPAIGFFFLLSPPIPAGFRLRGGRLASLGVATIALLALGAVAAVPLQTVRAYRTFGLHMQGMEQVLRACPPAESVLTVRLGDHHHPAVDVPVFRELPSWVQVVHGGYSPMAFTRPIPFPFKTQHKLPSPHWRKHGQYRRYLDPAHYGCVLTHRHTGSLPGDVWKRGPSAGAWQLYLRQ